MKRTQFYFHAKDQTELNAYRWGKVAEQQPKAIVQLAHGMAEHILRYEDFCEFLVKNDFFVYGNDHRGHGNTIKAPDDKGFFAKQNGFEKVVEDMKQLTDIIKDEYPKIPLFILGHSMGSFLTRRYIQRYGKQVDGVIFSGTGGDKGLIGKIGLILAKWERRRKGARTPSPFLNKLTFGSYNKNFTPARTEFDFLTRDQSVVDAYMADDKCGFICTAGFYVDLISGIELIHKKEELEKTPKDIPIFLIAGDQDPVGRKDRKSVV